MFLFFKRFLNIFCKVGFFSFFFLRERGKEKVKSGEGKGRERGNKYLKEKIEI